MHRWRMPWPCCRQTPDRVLWSVGTAQTSCPVGVDRQFKLWVCGSTSGWGSKPCGSTRALAVPRELNCPERPCPLVPPGRLFPALPLRLSKPLCGFWSFTFHRSLGSDCPLPLLHIPGHWKLSPVPPPDPPVLTPISTASQLLCFLVSSLQKSQSTTPLGGLSYLPAQDQRTEGSTSDPAHAIWDFSREPEVRPPPRQPQPKCPGDTHKGDAVYPLLLGSRSHLSPTGNMWGWTMRHFSFPCEQGERVS